MASPQCENGYTKIANELLEAYLKVSRLLSPYENAVWLAVVRKTFGYRKKEDSISLSQLEAVTNIRLCHLSRTKKKLSAKNMIVNCKGRISIQKDYEKWKLPKQVTSGRKLLKIHKIKNVTQLGNLPKQVNTKENILLFNKRNILTSLDILIPDWFPQKEFVEYQEMRMKIRRPMTKRAVELAVMRLEKLKNQGHDPKAVLEQSILNSWQGLFPLKETGDYDWVAAARAKGIKEPEDES